MVQSIISELDHLRGRVQKAQDYTVTAKQRVSNIIDGISTTLKQKSGQSTGSFGNGLSKMMGGGSTMQGFGSMALGMGSTTRAHVHSKVAELKGTVARSPKLDNNMKSWITGKLNEITKH